MGVGVGHGEVHRRVCGPMQVFLGGGDVCPRLGVGQKSWTGCSLSRASSVDRGLSR